ncbi:acetylglutamate kinase [Bacillus manliponensis]|uniref:acetylglutamate kinase n=1 Tax=Bacillus manliponensis TaxID=574376 RepID=UPI003514EC59
MKECIVVKCGGSMLERLDELFFQSMKQLVKAYDVIVVHGGGPAIDDMLLKLHISSMKRDGLRVTSKEVMKVVQMVLGGSANKQVVMQLQSYGLDAFGMTGCDGRLLTVKPLENLGYVGEIQNVNIALLRNLLEHGCIPVVAPIGVYQGEVYNINGDTAAASIAVAVGAKKLFFVTDVDGVMCEKQLLRQTDEFQIAKLIEKGIITGGMIPKVQAALTSIEMGVKEVAIVNGTKLFVANDGEWIGTTVSKGVNIS